MKIAHIADTHIRNLKYHKEYREAFSHLYKRLTEEGVDYIVHCGDIAHTKTQISPEFVDLCASFFQNLADIAPTYIILGNHDGNLKNSSRQDALSPIVDALAHPELHLAKDSGEILLDDGLVLNVLSVFDRDNWVAPSDREAINIALYHGSISNCKTDLGWMMENGEDTLDILTLTIVCGTVVPQFSKTMEKRMTRVFYYGRLKVKMTLLFAILNLKTPSRF